MFEHLKKLAPQMHKHQEYQIPETNDILHVRFAGERNKAYYKDLVKFASSQSRVKIPKEDLQSFVRSRNRKLYAKHIIVGWELDCGVEFNQEHLEYYLSCLPDEPFDELCLFCIEYKNFTEQHEEDAMDVEALAKN